MKPYALLIAVLAAPVASAQVHVTVDVPTFHFQTAPSLVVVEPGIQVVPAYDEEVFFVDGHYWTRRQDRWFRTRDWHGGWGEVTRRDVPPGLVRIPAGHYRRWRAEEHAAKREERREERREDRREDRKADRREERREDRAEQKHERREERRDVHEASPINQPPGHDRHEDKGRHDKH